MLRYTNDFIVYCRDGGLIADVYETTPVMSTYLLAFVVGDFGHSELQARPGLTVGHTIPTNIWVHASGTPLYTRV